VKKKTTVVAGVARAVGGMESPLGYDDNDSVSLPQITATLGPN